MKDRLRQLVTMIVLISGVGELAASQIHILTSTKLFAPEVGFYLFLFIIFGLTTGFNAVLLKNVRGAIVLIGSGLLAAWSGFIYHRIAVADIAQQVADAVAKGREPKVTMDDVGFSLTLVLVSIAIYLVGIVLIPLLSWGKTDSSAVA